MKLHELFENTLQPLRLKTDNPGGEWLEHKKEDTISGGRRPSGRFTVLGSTTAWFNREAFVPVDLLKKIPGTNQEQKNIRADSLEYLKQYMDKHGKLPDADWHEFNEYAPFIVVDQEGAPYVNEGNHRIMAAAELGFKVLAVEIKYFNGGETEQGILHPENVLQYDRTSISQGFGFGKYR